MSFTHKMLADFLKKAIVPLKLERSLKILAAGPAMLVRDGLDRLYRILCTNPIWIFE